MPEAGEWTKVQNEAILDLFDTLPPHEAVALNPADALHRAAIETALTAAGRTPDRYPALYAALEGSAGDKPDHLRLMDAGATKAGKATAMSWHASGHDHAYSGGTLFALDGDSGELLALGHNSNVGEGFVPISTKGSAARPAGKALKVMSINHSMTLAGAAQFTVSTWFGPIVDNGVTFYIQDPTLSPKYPAQGVKIAVGRKPGWINTDVDYWYQDRDNYDDPSLIVPFVGRAILPYDIIGTLGQPIPNAQLETQLYYLNNGSTTVIQMSLLTKNFASAVTMAAAAEVDWSYPYDNGFPDTTSSLVYDKASQVNGNTSYFAYNFQVPVDGPMSVFPFTVCSANTPEESSPQCHKILCNVTFSWHCLAEGTMVTMADGSSVAVETLNNSHRIRTGQSDAELGIEATTRGAHRAGDDEPSIRAVYRLSTDAGHELIATGRHLILTPNGLVPMEAVTAGNSVATTDGVVTVTGCDPIPFDGRMYNLKLGDDTDRDAGLATDAVNTYVANGIIVGDLEAEKAEYRRLTRDIGYMRGRLPETLHADYASAIEDMLY